MQRLAEYIARDSIKFLTGINKQQALDTLVEALAASHDDVEDAEALRRAIFEREKILSTGIGLGIAIPHAKIAAVKRFVLAIGISHAGIPFDSLDGRPVHIIVMIAGPEGRQGEYLKVLARTTVALKNEENRRAILQASDEDAVFALFSRVPEE